MEQLFKIKPLVWEKSDMGPSGRSWKSSTDIAVLYAEPHEWAVFYHNTDGPWPDKGSASSLDEAKAAAEEHYRKRLLQALEPVDAMQYRDVGEVRKDLEEFARKGPSS